MLIERIVVDHLKQISGVHCPKTKRIIRIAIPTELVASPRTHESSQCFRHDCRYQIVKEDSNPDKLTHTVQGSLWNPELTLLYAYILYGLKLHKYKIHVLLFLFQGYRFCMYHLVFGLTSIPLIPKGFVSGQNTSTHSKLLPE